MSKAITTTEKKNKGGRPPVKLTDEEKEKIVHMAAICTTQQIADYFGIARDTFRQIRIRDEEVSSLYKKGRVAGHLIVASKLMDKIQNGDVTAMIFYLKTQSGWSSKSNSEEKIKIPLGNRSGPEIFNDILITLEKGEISIPEVQQLTGLALAKMNIESRTQVDKVVSEQMSIDEAKAFAKELDQTLRKLDLLEQHIKVDTKK